MDKIIHATAAEGAVKMAVITARGMVQRAREIHDCSPTAAAALGRTLCAASLLGESMKEEKASLTIRINGGGPIGSVVAVSDSEGYVRGYVDNPLVHLPLRSDGKLNVGGAVGRDGTLTVSRDIGLKEPYIGSGGFLVQLMPGADDSLIDKLEENIFLMDQLTTILDEDGTDAIFAQVLKGMEYHLVGEAPVGYRCPCSRERVEEALACLEGSELDEMANQGETIRVSCEFCGAEYAFSPAELLALRQAKKEN